MDLSLRQADGGQARAMVDINEKCSLFEVEIVRRAGGGHLYHSCLVKCARCRTLLTFPSIFLHMSQNQPLSEKLPISTLTLYR